MRKILSVVFIISLILNTSLILKAQDDNLKPEKFPYKTIKLLKANFQDEIFLDTIALLNTDFSDCFTKEDKANSDFGIVESEELIIYLDYLYVRNILGDLDILENESESDIRKGFIFKLEIELEKKPISISDLKFVYNNWEIK